MTVGATCTRTRTPATPQPATGETSSSVIVRRAPVTAPIPCAFAAEPVTVTARSASSRLLSTAAIDTVSAAFAVAPAGIVIAASEPTV